MRRCLAVLLILAGTARAADEPKPNTLTPQEIAEGWMLLFDGETDFGWKTVGEAKVHDGILTLGGAKESSIQTTSMFGSFLLHFSFRYEGAERFRIHMLGNKSGLRDRNPSQWRSVEKRVESNERGTSIDTSILPKDPTVNPSRVNTRQKGPADIGFSIEAGGKLFLRDIKLKPLGFEPIFNGKDLSGWKRFTADEKRAKSKFSVTPDGWLNVTNGPGELQTEKSWADFVFQGECISNGKHLNSGVFFRCLQGQYQQGYEFQVQNGYKDGDRTRPADYGTGAIYRRVPARKVVSNDGEWFTMTLVARGNHIATWVNGYQTVDWTDTRPDNDNARNGCKLGAGPISLQGHDPTTNLSFRNLRVAELK